MADLHYDQVVLLLHGDGSDNGTTITDQKGHTIARDNAVTKTGEKKFGTASLYATNTGFHTGAGTDFNLGAGDFTIEFWFNFTALPANGVSHWIFNSWGIQSDRCAYAVNVYNTSGSYYLRFYYGVSTSLLYKDFPVSLATGQWYHFALSRASGTLRAYLDGTQVGTDQSVASTINNTYYGLYWFGGANGGPSGYMDDFRMTKGYARYVPDAVVPTDAYPANSAGDPDWASVTCLLHMDGSDNGTTFTDEVAGNSVAVSGNSCTKTGTKVFGAAGGYFDGSGDYLTVTSTNGFMFGTGDFTIECWVYKTAATLGMVYRINDIYLAYNHNTNKFNIYPGTGSSADSVTTWQLNTWYHTRVVRTGGLLSLYVNGIFECSIASTHNYTTSVCTVGGLTAYAGYIDDFRVTKGVARYTSPDTFTPHTSTHPDSRDETYDPYWSNVALLMHMDGSDNGTTFTDVKGHSVTVSGDTKTKTGVLKYGTASGYFDGTTDYIEVTPDSEFNLGTRDCTLECWVYLTSATNLVKWIVDSRSNGVLLAHDATNVLSGEFLGATITAHTTQWSANRWYHVALVRANGSVRLFLDGVPSAASTVTTSGGTMGTFRVGRLNSNTSNTWQGYIDDLRYTPGVARYQTTFTPPTTALPHDFVADYGDLPFDQSWSMSAFGGNIVDLIFDQRHALTAPDASGSADADQRWSLLPAIFFDQSFSAAYGLHVMDFADSLTNQRWSLSSMVFANLSANQKWSSDAPVAIVNQVANHRWTLAAYAFANKTVSQRWTLNAYTVANRTANQSWGLTGVTLQNIVSGFYWRINTFTVGSRIADQSWTLDAYLSAGLVAGQKWTLTSYTLGDHVLRQQWRQDAPVIKDHIYRQRWAMDAVSTRAMEASASWSLAGVVIADTWSEQSWQLLVPEFADGLLDQAWTLVAPTMEDREMSALWQIDTPTISEWEWRTRWTLAATAIWTRVVTSVTYTLTLTGAADSTTDLVLPMSNYRSELRSDQSSYLQVTVPNGRLYSGQIAARSNGELVISRGIRWSDGEIEVDEIARATLETIIPYVGGRSSSVALQARRAPVTTTPQTLALSGASYWTRSGNKLRYRCPIDNRLRPGDTVQIDGNEFVVGTVQHTAGAMGSQMEIVEA